MRKIFHGSPSAIFQIAMICFLLFFCANCEAQKIIRQKHVERYENGKIKIRGAYKNSVKHGNWFYYQVNGLMQKREYWKNGTLNTIYIYNEKGRLESITDKDGNTRYVNNCNCHS